jgi:hypothetical protein
VVCKVVSGTTEAPLSGEVRSDITASNAERPRALPADRVLFLGCGVFSFRFFVDVSGTLFDSLASGLSKLAERFCVSAADDDDGDDDGSVETLFAADVDVEVEAVAGPGSCKVDGVGAGAADGECTNVVTVVVGFGVVGNIFSRRAFRNTATSALMLFATGAQLWARSLSIELNDC